MKQFKLIVKPIAVILTMLSFFMLIGAIAAICFNEYKCAIAFIITIIFIIYLDIIMFYISKSAKKADLSLRSGFLLVAFVWISVSFLGSFPYILSGAIPQFSDALFESVSGFTTTGASILSDIEAMPKSMLLWRAFTHWIGGGGIIIFSVAILPLLGIGGMNLIKAEASGMKVDKLAPRIAQTAKYLWILYATLTVILFILLVLGGMGYLDAICHAFATISTGGFSSRNASVGYFESSYIQWVITTFMILGALNFTLIIRVVRGEFSFLKLDSEFKAFLFIFVVASIAVSISIYGERAYNWLDAFRYGAFQIAAVITTTGFGTDDYETWPAVAQSILFVLFFVGGCSGSTAGGMKVIRYVVMFKQLVQELKYFFHPRAVFVYRINNEPARSGLVYAVASYFFIFMMSVLALTIVVAISGVDVLTSFTAVLSTVSTVGPGFGQVGPSQNFGFFSDYVKYILCFAMMLGRLEIYTLLVLFTPWFWKIK